MIFSWIPWIPYLLVTKRLLFWNFRRLKIRSFLEPKSWRKDDIYWILKSSCFELFRDGIYGSFWPKKLMERWHLLITGKFLFWAFRWWEIRCFFQRKSWWKDDIYLVFLSFPWYSRTWEIWLFVQWGLHVLIFRILETYPSKDIDLSVMLSHINDVIVVPWN